MMHQSHDIRDLIRIFNDLFQQRYQTVLVAGDDEPVYRPADDQHAHHRLIFAHGFFASALHEISHWCVAGPERRQLEDFGYWYQPDGRTHAEQAEFERVEVKPQAYEWIFSAASGHPFHFSADNLDTGCGPSVAFQDNVRRRVAESLAKGLPERPRQLCDALTAFYNTPGPEALLTLPEFSAWSGTAAKATCEGLTNQGSVCAGTTTSPTVQKDGELTDNVREMA